MAKRKKPAPDLGPVARPMVPRLSLSVQEAANTCGMSKSFLYIYMNSGELRFLKAGARRLVLLSDLEAFLASLVQGPGAA